LPARLKGLDRPVLYGRIQPQGGPGRRQIGGSGVPSWHGCVLL